MQNKFRVGDKVQSKRYGGKVHVIKSLGDKYGNDKNYPTLTYEDGEWDKEEDVELVEAAIATNDEFPYVIVCSGNVLEAMDELDANKLFAYMKKCGLEPELYKRIK